MPGTGGLPADVAARLAAAWRARPPDYRPRTRHLRSGGGPKYTNRLFLEASPYLRQHAHNPVNWYPWGDEAFAAARRLGRPILLSVGYSTCHWCHVMEEESFEDEEVARYLNAHYVAIKVDREERPDIDEIYMTAVQRSSGRGGWPMTVWLTPDGRPFYGATYLPRDALLAALRQLRAAYDRDPTGVAARAAELAAAVRVQLEQPAGAPDLPDAALLHKAARIFVGRLDPTDGGAVGRPKFPSGMPVRFLLRYHRRTGDAGARRAALLTLRKMAAGGIYDHVGGGFHRYSTDTKWLVPHFEKMLYDNAQLAMAYVEGYQATGDPEFARVVREILRWAERDMMSPDGVFYAATDADSLDPKGERREGWFYTWTPAELAAALGADRAPRVAAYYGVTDAGDFDGRSILHVARFGAPRPRDLDEINDLLYRARARRPAPARDDKVLVDWNALMISAFARAAIALRDPDDARRAVTAAKFIWDRLRDGRGRLSHSYAGGRARVPAYLEDYAFLCAAMLDLYEATGALEWLERAVDLDRTVEAHFEDRTAGGFFRTSDDHERLLAREKPRYDGAVPTGTSVHVLNLLRLSEYTADERYRQRAELAMGQVGAMLRRAPSAMSEMLLAIDFYLDRPKQIVVVVPHERAEAEAFVDQLATAYVPNRAVAIVRDGEVPQVARRVPLVADKVAQGGEATAYVCEHRVCQLPTADPAVFARQIRKVYPLPGGGS
ncbi:MAG: thioredoxin domain-containing protein [Deltaproteobacteria bacterium]|nr:MAG: thioredoxin domain-containing protein [Deltaproteobacteria bacterium]